jgi:hypothetical protein
VADNDFDIPMPTYRVPRARQGMLSGLIAHLLGRPLGGTMPMDRRAIGLAAAGGGAALLLLASGWGVFGHGGPAPVVEPDPTPYRVRPADPGGMTIADQDESILSGTAGTQVEQLAPPAETPELAALRAQQAPSPPARPTPAADTSATAPPAPAPAALPPLAPPLSPPLSPPPPVVAAPAAVATANPAIQHATAQPGMRAQTAAMAVPPHPAAAAAAPPAAAKPDAAKTAKPMQIQLAAVDSEQGAKDTWERFSKKMPELLGGRTPRIVKYEHDGKVFYRLRLSGTMEAEAAARFCGRAQAKGVTCSPVSF